MFLFCLGPYSRVFYFLPRISFRNPRWSLVQIQTNQAFPLPDLSKYLLKMSTCTIMHLACFGCFGDFWGNVPMLVPFEGPTLSPTFPTVPLPTRDVVLDRSLGVMNSGISDPEVRKKTLALWTVALYACFLGNCLLLALLKGYLILGSKRRTRTLGDALFKRPQKTS